MSDVLERTAGAVPRLVRIVLAIGFAWLAIAHHATATLNRYPGPGRGDVSLADVRDAGIFPARAWLDGVNPWDREAFRAFDDRIGQDFPPYSPVHVALHLPFARAPLEGAREAFYWVSLALTVVFARQVIVVAGRRPTLESTAVVFGAILWSHPGSVSLVSGQSGIVLAIGAVLALTASAPAAAVGGVVLVLSKPTFGVPLLAMVVARHRTRTAVLGAVVATLVSVMMLVRLVASVGVRELVDRSGNDLEVTAPLGSAKRVDLASTLARVVDRSPGLWFELVIGVAVLAAGFVAVRRLGRLRPTSDAGLALAFCVPSLALFHGSWDLVTVIPAFALLLRSDPGCRLADRWRWVVVGLMGYALWNPWGRRFSEGLYDDRLTALLAARLRTAAFVAAVAILLGAAWWPRATRNSAAPA